jgi:N-acetyl-anhydromuramyl-L-alanine amidase AmpD
MAFSLTWLPGVLQGSGLKVAEVPGWTDRGRREMGRVEGVICHHTATRQAGNMPSLRLLVEGRSDLPGPLAQLGLGRDGTYYVIAAGRCNHAGAGDGIWSRVDGNSHYLGIEAENGGRPQDGWPDVQMDAYRRGVAAILRHIGAGADRCIAHREYAPTRKPDVRFDMNRFRADVADVMRGGPVGPLIPARDSARRPTLRRGDRGEDVRQVQRKLGLPDDGRFGPVTEAAVRHFQRERDLVPDGIVGPRSWAALDAI